MQGHIGSRNVFAGYQACRISGCWVNILRLHQSNVASNLELRLDCWVPCLVPTRGSYSRVTEGCIVFVSLHVRNFSISFSSLWPTSKFGGISFCLVVLLVLAEIIESLAFSSSLASNRNVDFFCFSWLRGADKHRGRCRIHQISKLSSCLVLDYCSHFLTFALA